MRKQEIQNSIQRIEDAVSAMLQTVKCVDDGEGDRVCLEWLMQCCVNLNDVKLNLKGELDMLD